VHDVYVPHCSYCEHFKLCFRTDMVTEWGYCCFKGENRACSQQELEAIRREVESGNYRTLLARASDLGLFVPTTTDCEHYSDAYPI